MHSVWRTRVRPGPWPLLPACFGPAKALNGRLLARSEPSSAMSKSTTSVLRQYVAEPVCAREKVLVSWSGVGRGRVGYLRSSSSSTTTGKPRPFVLFQ